MVAAMANAASQSLVQAWAKKSPAEAGRGSVGHPTLVGRKLDKAGMMADQAQIKLMLLTNP
jgi:hypothetical protein